VSEEERSSPAYREKAFSNPVVRKLFSTDFLTLSHPVKGESTVVSMAVGMGPLQHPGKFAVRSGHLSPALWPRQREICGRKRQRRPPRSRQGRSRRALKRTVNPNPTVPRPRGSRRHCRLGSRPLIF